MGFELSINETTVLGPSITEDERGLISQNVSLIWLLITVDEKVEQTCNMITIHSLTFKTSKKTL